jgi:ankyrin repeat protein
MTLTDFPNELLFYVLFSSHLSAKDVLNFLLSSRETVQILERFKEDSYAMRKWFSLMPYMFLARNEHYLSFVDRHALGIPFETNKQALFETMLCKPYKKTMTRAMKLCVPEQTYSNSGLVNKAARFKNPAAALVLLDAGYDYTNVITGDLLKLAVLHNIMPLFEIVYNRVLLLPLLEQPLDLACRKNRIEIIKFVYQDRPGLGFSVLFPTAIQAGNIDLAEFLMQHDPATRPCDVITVNAIKGLIVRRSTQDFDKVMQWIEYAPSLGGTGHNDVQAWIYNEATIFAAGFTNTETFVHLFTWCLVNAKKAFLAACTCGNLDVVEYYTQKPNVDCKVITFHDNMPLRAAAENGHHLVVEHLLKFDFVRASAHKSYALRNAAANGHLRVVKLLVNHRGTYSSDIAAKDYAAIRVAWDRGHSQIVSYLCEKAEVDVVEFIEPIRKSRRGRK